MWKCVKHARDLRDFVRDIEHGFHGDTFNWNDAVFSKEGVLFADCIPVGIDLAVSDLVEDKLRVGFIGIL